MSKLVFSRARVLDGAVLVVLFPSQICRGRERLQQLRAVYTSKLASLVVVGGGGRVKLHPLVSFYFGLLARVFASIIL